MELILLVVFAGAIWLGRWLQRRWVHSPRFELWVAVGGGLILLMLAWGGAEGDRGPRIVLTLGAVVGLWRAFSLYRDRERGPDGA